MPTDKRERQRLNREAKRAAARKHQRRIAIRKGIVRWGTMLVLFLGVFAVLSLFRGGDDEPEGPPLGPSDYQGFRSQETACDGSKPDALVLQDFEGPEDQGLSGTLTATIATSCGDIEIALDADAYPETVNSFVFLAREGFYDSTVCHRLVEGSILQCGDQTATGAGDAGYSVPDEFPDEGFVYERGVVAMANAGPDTTGSQFFIVIGDASQLDNAFSVLGTVVDSEDTLAALAEVPLGVSPGPLGEISAPLETVYIEDVTIDE